jgi:acetolactate synthase-1/2/3 large subunit
MTNDSANARTGGRILVDALRIHGADTVFSVAGESYLALLDALYDVQNEIRLITCRKETGASNMAEAYGKLTGKPGICVVTRGPGACHASIGVHTAFQDSTPMILLIGDVPRHERERESFQEVDYGLMYAPLAKWVVRIDQPRRIPELIARAFRTATSGRAGRWWWCCPKTCCPRSARSPTPGPMKPPMPIRAMATWRSCARSSGPRPAR